MMNELELRENLSSKTVDVLVETIIQLSKLITELEMEVSEEDKKCADDNRINNVIDSIIGAGDGSRA